MQFTHTRREQARGEEKQPKRMDKHVKRREEEDMHKKTEKFKNILKKIFKVKLPEPYWVMKEQTMNKKSYNMSPKKRW